MIDKNYKAILTVTYKDKKSNIICEDSEILMTSGGIFEKINNAKDVHIIRCSLNLGNIKESE